MPGKQCYTAWLQRESPCPWCLAPNLWKSGEAQNAQFWAFGIYYDAYWIPVNGDLYLHYAFDNTEKQKTKEALIQAQEELEIRIAARTGELQKSHALLLHSEKLSAVGKLSASIAHEFNNPLQSVMTILKGIGEYVPLKAKEQELITLALQECHRMKDLIANLRDFFRPTSGRLEQVDLHATIDNLLLFCKKDFQTHTIRIQKKYADNLPVIVAVADQLKQVFLNLLNNAQKPVREAG